MVDGGTFRPGVGGVVHQGLAVDDQLLRSEGIDVEGVVPGGRDQEVALPDPGPVVVAKPGGRDSVALEPGLPLGAGDDGRAGPGEPGVVGGRQALEIRRPDHAVRASGVHEERIRAQAVAIPEVRELPGRERRTIPLPVSDLAGARGVEIVEVAGEVDLAVVVDVDPVALLRPDDVVPEMDVVGRVRMDPVGHRLVEGVVGDLVGRGALLREEDRVHCVIVEEGVGNREDPARVGRGHNAILVRVDDIPRDRKRPHGGANPHARIPVDARRVDGPALGHDSIRVSMDVAVPEREPAVAVDAVTGALVHPGVRHGEGPEELEPGSVVVDLEGVEGARCAPFLADPRPGVPEDRGPLDRQGAKAPRIEAVAVVGADQVLDCPARPTVEAQAVVAGMVGDGDVLEEGEVAPPVEQDALLGVVADNETLAREAVGAVGGLDADAAAREGEEPDLHEVGIIEVEQRLGGVARDRGGELRGARGVRGPAEEEPAVDAETHARAAGHDRGVDHRIEPGVDVQDRSAGELVGPEDIDRVRLRGIGRLAGVPVVPDRPRRVFIVRVARVIDVIGVAGLGNRERLGAPVEDGRIADKGDLDPEPLGTEVDAAGGRDPAVLAIIGGGRCDGGEQGRPVHRVVAVEVDPHVRLGDVIVGFPADEAGFVAFPVGVEVREPERDPGAGRLGGLGSRVAIGPLVGRHRVVEDVGKRPVEEAVVLASGLAVGLEAIPDRAGSDRHMDPGARELPAVDEVLGRAQAADADHRTGRVEEVELDLPLVSRALVEGPDTAAEHHHKILRVELGGVESSGREVDHLLGESLPVARGEEVRAPGIGRRRVSARPGSHARGPTGDPGLKARVGEEVHLRDRHAGVREGVGAIDRRAREPLPAHQVKDPVVVRPPVVEAGLRPVGMN